MIQTLKITLVGGAYFEEPWEGELEIRESATLAQLHLAIQRALDFGNDHLFEFYAARSPRGKRLDAIQYNDTALRILSFDNLISSSYNCKWYYHFDFGDDWLFQIAKSRKKPHPPAKGVKYPRLVKETGKRPVQYPDFGEDWE